MHSILRQTRQNNNQGLIRGEGHINPLKTTLGSVGYPSRNGNIGLKWGGWGDNVLVSPLFDGRMRHGCFN